MRFTQWVNETTPYLANNTSFEANKAVANFGRNVLFERLRVNQDCITSDCLGSHFTPFTENN